MADESPERTLEEFQAIAQEHGGVLGFRYAGDFWDVYVCHVELLHDPPYRPVVSIDVGGTIHLVPEQSISFRSNDSARSLRSHGSSVRSSRRARCTKA